MPVQIPIEQRRYDNCDIPRRGFALESLLTAPALWRRFPPKAE
jgi:hypothetical protein